MNVFRDFWRDERGQALAEAALLILFIALVCVLVIQSVGTQLQTFYDSMAAAFP
jgi:Flp pilus assembly pilin Flp